MKNGFKIILTLSVIVTLVIVIKISQNKPEVPVGDFKTKDESGHVQAAEEINHLIKQ